MVGSNSTVYMVEIKVFITLRGAGRLNLVRVERALPPWGNISRVLGGPLGGQGKGWGKETGCTVRRFRPE